MIKFTINEVTYMESTYFIFIFLIIKKCFNYSTYINIIVTFWEMVMLMSTYFCLTHILLGLSCISQLYLIVRLRREKLSWLLIQHSQHTDVFIWIAIQVESDHIVLVTIIKLLTLLASNFHYYNNKKYGNIYNFLNFV